MTAAFNTERIYVKKIGIFDPYTVWLVDGAFVRKEINENFVEFDHHAHIPHIPPNELWIDDITHHRERRFFIDTAITEQALIDSGVPKELAYKKALRQEARERARSLPENLRSLRGKHDELLKHIRKDFLQEHSTPSLKIWLIRGKFVRDFLLTEYALGGHDRVYPFIPEGEIWIEDILSESERRFIILHELHERLLMGAGKGYAAAHQGANIVEDYYRNNPKGLEQRIQEELLKHTP